MALMVSWHKTPYVITPYVTTRHYDVILLRHYVNMMMAHCYDVMALSAIRYTVAMNVVTHWYTFVYRWKVYRFTN